MEEAWVRARHRAGEKARGYVVVVRDGYWEVRGRAFYSAKGIWTWVGFGCGCLGLGVIRGIWRVGWMSWKWNRM
jgi:hypothetical protein